jgi:hypothetical protein
MKSHILRPFTTFAEGLSKANDLRLSLMHSQSLVDVGDQHPLIQRETVNASGIVTTSRYMFYIILTGSALS